MAYKNVWEYTDPVADGQLAYLSIACTTYCNLACLYCSKKKSKKQDIDPAFLIRILDEAIDLGLKKVEFTGGEPLLYPFFMESVEYLVKRNVTVLIVTNGTLLDQETAKKLADLGVGVSISLSTLKREKFDRMSQTKGLLKNIINSLKFLNISGYRAERMPLAAIQSIASRDTQDELKELKNFAEQHDCMFIINRAIPVGGLHATNVPTGGELKELLDTLGDTHSEVRVPFSSDTPCNRLKAGCYITSDALVQPCPAINLVAGDLKKQSLSVIWNLSPVLQKSRLIHTYLEGSCAVCPENHRCYGCRAVAFAVWGSLSAPDPGCFRFVPDHKFNEEYHLKEHQ